MTIKILLSSGKEIELSKEEFTELISEKIINIPSGWQPMDWEPYTWECTDAPWDSRC